MDKKSFYYSKAKGYVLLAILLVTAAGFTYTLTMAGSSLLYLVGMGVLAISLWAVIFVYVIKNWLLRASRNEAYFEVDKDGIDLKNGYTPIKWTEIDRIGIGGGRNETTIGIKLTDAAAFLARQPLKKNDRFLNWNNSLNGYHFLILGIKLDGKTYVVCDELKALNAKYGIQ